MSEKRFAALGSRKKLLPLKSIGFDIYECSNFKEASDIISKLSDEEYDLVIISENILENNENSFLEITRNLSLIVLVLPEYGMRKDFAKGIVKKVTKEAVGF